MTTHFISHGFFKWYVLFYYNFDWLSVLRKLIDYVNLLYAIFLDSLDGFFQIFPLKLQFSIHTKIILFVKNDHFLLPLQFLHILIICLLLLHWLVWWEQYQIIMMSVDILDFFLILKVIHHLDAGFLVKFWMKMKDDKKVYSILFHPWVLGGMCKYWSRHIFPTLIYPILNLNENMPYVFIYSCFKRYF